MADEIKSLYEELNTASAEDREKIWKLIVEKNKSHLTQKRENLKTLFKNYSEE